MEREKQIILVVASRVLSYPDDNFIAEGQDIKDCISDNITSAELLHDLNTAVNSLYDIGLTALQKKYVETFDLKSRLGLYLTAHELGDSTKRGAAIIKLQNIIKQGGFERVNDELSDYMPILFEFIAVTPDSEDNNRLIRRLAVAVQRVFNNLPAESPYFGILSILMKYVFPEPTKEEIEKLEFEREEADLEELPYPIMYS